MTDRKTDRETESRQTERQTHTHMERQSCDDVGDEKDIS